MLVKVLYFLSQFKCCSYGFGVSDVKGNMGVDLMSFILSFCVCVCSVV